MPRIIPFTRGMRIQRGDAYPSPTSVTTGSVSNTKGSPAQVIAATLFDTHYVTIIATGYHANATATPGCMDLLIGASTEAVLIENMLHGYAAGLVGVKSWGFPLYIPAGSRLSVAAAGVLTSTAFNVFVVLQGCNGHAPWRVGELVTTYGMGTIPAGTILSAATTPTPGTWAQIVGSTARDHFALVPSLQPNAETAVDDINILAEVGIGAGGAEAVIGSALFRTTGTQEQMTGSDSPWPIWQPVPAGSRLAMRATRSAGNDNYQGVIHAVA